MASFTRKRRHGVVVRSNDKQPIFSLKRSAPGCSARECQTFLRFEVTLYNRGFSKH